MNKKVTTILCGAGVGAALLFAAPIAGADPTTPPTPGPTNNSWGQAVSGCNTSSCYPGGENRGAFVGPVAGSNPNGFANNLHQSTGTNGGNPPMPGNSNPAPFSGGGTPGH
jgi:hypothetical protein